MDSSRTGAGNTQNNPAASHSTSVRKCFKQTNMIMEVGESSYLIGVRALKDQSWNN